MELPKEIQSIFIYEGEDLVSFGLLPPYHLTFHSGPYSGIADIHIKNESKSKDENRYVTLIKIPNELFGLIDQKVHQRIESIIPRFFWRRINLGKLHKHFCFLIDIDPESGFEQFVVRKGKRRIKLKPEINESVIDSIILSPQDKKLGEKEGGHIVFKQTKTGIRLEGLVVFPSLQFGRKPFFIKQRELMKFAMEYISIIFYVCKELDIWMNPELIELFERHRKGQAVSFDNLLKEIS